MKKSKTPHPFRSRAQTLCKAELPVTSVPELKSAWQATQLEDFFQTAAENEKDFAALRHPQLVNASKIEHTESHHDTVPDSHGVYLPIPRRPSWRYDETKAELEVRERDYFLTWRREVNSMEQKLRPLVVSPYEKNLEVWRQLWRVAERSSLILQIVDARNPLGFRCLDLEKYVVESNRLCVLVLNKADLLTSEQREQWAKYFTRDGIPFLFFSAIEDGVSNVEPELVVNHKVSELSADKNSAGTSSISTGEKRCSRRRHHKSSSIGTLPPWVNSMAASGGDLSLIRHSLQSLAGGNVDEADRARNLTVTEHNRTTRAKSFLEENPAISCSEQLAHAVFNSSRIFTPKDLVDTLLVFYELWKVESCSNDGDGQTVFESTSCNKDGSSSNFTNALHVGLVGYPNVGKSSVLNFLQGKKRVTVSHTPGKTKHLQTLYLEYERRLVLVDCPGLVFPVVGKTEEEMTCDGILPVATMRDYAATVEVVCGRVPQDVLERRYGVDLTSEWNEPNLSLGERLMDALAVCRGYVGKTSTPNRSRAALLILRDYLNGRILYVHLPPGTTSEKSLRHRSVDAEVGCDSSDEWSSVTSLDIPLEREENVVNEKHLRECSGQGKNPFACEASRTSVESNCPDEECLEVDASDEILISKPEEFVDHPREGHRRGQSKASARRAQKKIDKSMQKTFLLQS